MKKLFKKPNVIKLLVGSFLIGLFSILAMPELQATHYRYGNITWENTANPNEVKFTVQLVTRRTFWNPDATVGQTITPGYLYFGQGSARVLMNMTVTSVNLSEDWAFSEYSTTFTYSSSGDKIAYFSRCCRISSLQNNDDLNFRIESKVNVGSSNRPPSIVAPPILNMEVGQNTADFQLISFDLDGDPLTYRFATSQEAMGNNNYQFAAGLSISPSGLLSFNTTGKTIGHLYTTSIVVEDATSKTMVDVLIKMVGSVGDPPVFDPPTPANGAVFNVIAGQPIIPIDIAASDVDNDFFLAAAGVPIGASTNPPLPLGPGNPLSTQLTWTPQPADIGVNNVVFTATDLNGLQTSTVIILNVQVCDIQVSSSVSDVSCQGESDGGIDITLSNFTDPVTYSWSNGSNSEDLTNVSAGTYSVNLTDANNCTASHTATVGTTVDVTPPSINCPADATRLTDGGACDYTAGGGEFDPTATDNCNQTTNINNYNGGSTLDGASFDIGTTTVTWTTTDASGNMDVCSFDITVNKAADPTLLFAYTMIARKEVHVHESDVQSGGVGVWESGKKAKVHHESNVTSFVKAPIIDQDNNSTIGTSIIGEALVPLPVFRINTMSSNLDLKVEDNQMHTINPGDPIAYDKIEVKKNATLIVNVPELYGKEIKTKDGATISFGQTTEVMLEKKFDLDKNNTFNSTGEAVYVYTEKQMDVKEGGNVIANVYALNHIHVKGKSNSLTHMTGLYISDDKIKADKHSVWNWVASACTWPAPPAAPYIANTENSGIQTLKEITKEITKEGFEVFPNPANNEVNIRLHGEDVAGTHILIYDQLGKVVWERILTEYETTLKVNFSDTKFQTGIYTVAVISSDEVKAKRLVISK